MPQYKFRKVDEITLNTPNLEQAEAELGRQGLTGFVLVEYEPPVVEAAPVVPKAKPVEAVPVTVELICDSLTVPEMKAKLDKAGIKYAKNAKEATLAKKILEAGIFTA